MSAAATHEIDALIDALDADWSDPSAASDEEIEALLARRQETLDRLQSLDASGLGADDKARLHGRMTALHTRDQALFAELQQRMQSVGNQLGNAAQGRAAVRGYRAPEDDQAKLFIRPA